MRLIENGASSQIMDFRLVAFRYGDRIVASGGDPLFFQFAANAFEEFS
jgi:hypothetical protein